eukprot:TRINITY_DN3047_c0_g1_i2.p2 TRINITY_DN3047_c0_g1~~TRINITY_DN3047_c0_g1_i2.p2  ORF type:complete len:231 (-),score=15.51 TRINITY_DN3047_c0_g1_i2:734-1426(-)
MSVERNVRRRLSNSTDLSSKGNPRASTSGTGGGGSVGLPKARIGAKRAARAGGGLADLPARSAAQMARAYVPMLESNAHRAADSVSLLTSPGFGSIEPVALRGIAATAETPGLASARPLAAAAVMAAPTHFLWKTGERDKFVRAAVFDCPAVSRMSSRQLASAAFKGALKLHAAKFPDMEAEFIGGAEDHLLIGLSITCWGVPPADVAEQLVLRRVGRSSANLMNPVATW